MHAEAGKILSDICASDDVDVKVERTSTGLNARIDLPGSIDFNREGEDSDQSSCEDQESDMEETSARSDDKEIEIDESIEDSQHSIEIVPVESKQESTETRELKEINAELMRQVEKLRSQNEILEQQVAVLSEGSAYI